MPAPIAQRRLRPSPVYGWWTNRGRDWSSRARQDAASPLATCSSTSTPTAARRVMARARREGIRRPASACRGDRTVPLLRLGHHRACARPDVRLQPRATHARARAIRVRPRRRALWRQLRRHGAMRSRPSAGSTRRSSFTAKTRTSPAASRRQAACGCGSRAGSSPPRAATRPWAAAKCSASTSRNFCAEIFFHQAVRYHPRRRSRLTSHAWIRALPAVRFPCTHDVERRAPVAARRRRPVRTDGTVRCSCHYRPHPCHEGSCSAGWGALPRSDGGGFR